MFEGLQDRLDGIIHKVKGYGKITEENIGEMLREVRLALLEADVNYKVVKEFTSRVKDKALGEEVQKSLKPGEVFVKIVNDELIELLGGEKKELNLEGYKKMINEAAKTYPNFKVVATTLREVKTATVNDWSAICWADGKIYKAIDYKGLEILDRVGGGDSFASGLIYGLMTTNDPEKAVNYGAAHGALAMTTPGDTSMANLKEVENLMNGASARVQR